MRYIEIFRMALSALRAHKLRSSLTLVGIVAGVASIISVMTGISVVQVTMEKEMSVLGSRVFQVQKWPAGFDNTEAWREILKRRPITVEQANAIRERVKTVDLVGGELWKWASQVKYRQESTNSNIIVCGGTPEYPENNTHFVRLGANITNEDVAVGRRVAVIGHAIAEELFPFIDPIGQTIRLDGMKFTVKGVFEQKQSAIGGGFDQYVLIPIGVFKRTYGMWDERGRGERSVNVTVRAVSPDRLQDAIEETRLLLRSVRGVKPGEKDDFTIFTNDSNIKTFNENTKAVKIGAFVIGIVALIVAGIGIMNIMLVSVMERTREIGIRKALGARRSDILWQFLAEAVILCNIGGLLGVAVGFGLGNVVTLFTDFSVTTPINWADNGLVFCTAVGRVFGMWPALRASALAP
ncbi:MAG: ABC transporter permease, partial [Acidobacteriota bacterium]